MGENRQVADFKLDLLQLEELLEVERSAAPGLLQELLAQFTAFSTESIGVFHHALGAADFPLLEARAHSLKSSSAVLGLKELADTMRKLEQAAQSRIGIEACATLVQTAESLLPLALSALGDFLERSSARSSA